jgi:heme-degrading monooxygenase HmoA
MPILSTIEVVLKDEAAEKVFLEAFGKMLPHVNKLPGLLEFTPAKVVGAERKYLVLSVWQDETAIQKWLDQPEYQALRAKAREELISYFKARRWEPKGIAKEFGKP